uniref:Uncharacterized protein n=1 Tax=Wuchereria bancrofti TaxID=6293 RepID=A0A1I8ESB2_WUCBA
MHSNTASNYDCTPLLPNDNNAESGTNQAASTSNRSWLRRMINTTPFLEKSLSTIRSTGLFQESHDNGALCLSHYFHSTSCIRVLCPLIKHGTTPITSSSTELTVAMLTIECVAPERWIHRNIQQKVFEFTGVSCNQETPTSGSCHQLAFIS